MAFVFKLTPDEKFFASVPVPVPGKGTQPLEVEFRHQGKEAAAAWFGSIGGRDPAEALADVVTGWRNADAPFSHEALRDLLSNYPQAGMAMLETYARELVGARLGN